MAGDGVDAMGRDIAELVADLRNALVPSDLLIQTMESVHRGCWTTDRDILESYADALVARGRVIELLNELSAEVEMVRRRTAEAELCSWSEDAKLIAVYDAARGDKT